MHDLTAPDPNDMAEPHSTGSVHGRNLCVRADGEV